jgi:hypothetical protein
MVAHDHDRPLTPAWSSSGSSRQLTFHHRKTCSSSAVHTSMPSARALFVRRLSSVTRTAPSNCAIVAIRASFVWFPLDDRIASIG